MATIPNNKYLIVTDSEFDGATFSSYSAMVRECFAGETVAFELCKEYGIEYRHVVWQLTHFDHVFLIVQYSEFAKLECPKYRLSHFIMDPAIWFMTKMI